MAASGRVAVALGALLLALGSPGAAAPGHLGAMGIGVGDLEVSRDFYAHVLGLEVQRTYELGYIDEIVMGFPDDDGAVLVLMHWPGDDARAYDGNDVKLVFYVDDPAAVLARIRERGGTIDLEAAPNEVLGGTVVGLGRDPDNYVIEVIGR